MSKKATFLTFCFSVVLNTHLHAGWPEEGWEGVPSLCVTYKGQTANFDKLHQHLATEEEKIARTLPPNTPTNIVLASISFLGGDDSSLHTYPLKTHEKKWLVFESGWASSFIPSPVYDQTQKLMRPYASKLQKDDLTPADKEQLVQDCVRVAHGQHYFEEQVRPRFHFFDQEPISADYILSRVEQVFSQVDPSEAGYSIYKDLITNRAAFNRLASLLQEIKLEAGQDISELSQKINPSLGVNLSFIKEVADLAKSAHDQISRQEKELSSIGSKVISTYWHSEQKFLKYIEDETPNILTDIFKEPLPFTPEAVVINVHSRHDICPVCSHTFVRSYTRPEGVLNAFRDALCEKFAIDSQAVPLYITSSFRVKREKTKYAVRDDRPGILEDSITTIAPAFPTLYIPLSPHEYSPLPSSSSSSSSSSSGSGGSR
jgi:hypothetical protein